jgi:hypothetical protein
MRPLRRLTLTALVVVVCVLARAARIEAQILFEDGFESSVTDISGGISGWDGPHSPAVMYVTDQVARSGRRSVEMKYTIGSEGASYMYKAIPGQDQIYLRWYQRWSAGFIWEPSSTKMVILRPYAGYPQFYPEVLWANGQLAIQAQMIAEANWDSRNFYQNQGSQVAFGFDRWYCIEVFVKLNTPGAADGELAAWIDGELKLLYTGREFRGSTPAAPAPSTAKIEAIGISGHYGGRTPVPQLQYSWQDDHVASTQPIGCQVLSVDFETNTTNPDGGITQWDGPANPPVMYLTDQVSHSGGRSVELKYLPGSFGASYMYKKFDSQDQIYLRWYQRWSAGFVWGASSTGLVGLLPSRGYPRFYPVVLHGSGQLAIQAQGIAEADWGARNFYQNQGARLTFEPDRWYCVEVFVKLNTPGLANGELGAWIDGELKVFHAGRHFRGSSGTDPAPSTARIEYLLMTGHYGWPATVPQLQFSWQDDHVASTQRIGCRPYPPIVQ